MSFARQVMGLFGPIDDQPAEPKETIIPLDFERQRVRVVVIKGEPWWVLADVARVLGYGIAPHAARILRDKDRGIHRMDTLGGTQELIIVSEAGLYRLIMRSNKPEAERFQDWVTDEVLPSIRRTGGYRMGRIEKIRRRLRSDHQTAEIREKDTDINKSLASRIFADGGSPRDVGATYNAGYKAVFDGKDAAALKRDLKINKSDTPLNHMGMTVLSTMCHSKVVAEMQIRLKDVPLKEQPKIHGEAAKAVANHTLDQLDKNGTPCKYGMTQHPNQGLILDVIPLQIKCTEHRQVGGTEQKSPFSVKAKGGS